jgi:hypothetical protein
VDLGQRGVSVEPVKSLADGNGVHRPIAERDRLRRACESLDPGNGLDEPLPHRVHRLHRRDVGAELCQEAGELSSAGRQVEHRARRLDPKLTNEPPDGLEGIHGAPAFVVLGNEGETARGGLVDGGSHPSTS